MGKKPVAGMIGALWLGLTLNGCDCCHNKGKQTVDAPPPGAMSSWSAQPKASYGMAGSPTMGSAAQGSTYPGSVAPSGLGATQPGMQPAMGSTPASMQPGAAGSPMPGSGQNVGWGTVPASSANSGLMQAGASMPAATGAQTTNYPQASDADAMGSPAPAMRMPTSSAAQGNLAAGRDDIDSRPAIPPTPRSSSVGAPSLPASAARPSMPEMPTPPLPPSMAPPVPSAGAASTAGQPDLAAPPPPPPPGLAQPSIPSGMAPPAPGR